MFIENIKVRNLKIVKAKDVEFVAGINLITGENKVGKTTLYIAIQAAFSGQLKKHLINRSDEVKSCYIEVCFSHQNKHYQIVRTFYKAGKSSTARLLIDKKLYSESTSTINNYMQLHFKFFFSLGFIYHSKINKLMVEYNIKKNDFLIEFFELQSLIKLSSAVSKAVRDNKISIPDWYWSYKDYTKLSDKYKVKIEQLRSKIGMLRSNIDKLNIKLNNIKKYKDKKIISTDRYTELQDKKAKLLKTISSLETTAEAKEKIINSMDKISSNENICPTCLRPFDTKDSVKIVAKIKKELTALEAKIDMLDNKRTKVAATLRSVVITDVDINFSQYDKLTAKIKKYEETIETIHNHIYKYKHLIENWKEEKFEYDRLTQEIKNKQLDMLGNFSIKLSSLITTLAEKIKEDLLNKMNEFLSVIYDGNVFITLKDGQFYLLQNNHEVLFDDTSASGSELEIVTFIFVLALSIICGNNLILLDEIFNTTSTYTFSKVNNLLRYSQKYFQQIIIISHKETFEADNTIYLV